MTPVGGASRIIGDRTCPIQSADSQPADGSERGYQYRDLPGSRGPPSQDTHVCTVDACIVASVKRSTEGDRRAERNSETKPSRQEAARQCAAVFDTAFFERLAVTSPHALRCFRELVLLGPCKYRHHCRAPAAGRRSVITRHLQQLAAAGIVVAEKDGRHVFLSRRCRGPRQAA